MLLRRGLISMAAGADLLGGLEVYGPYMFLITGVVSTLVGLGLLRLNNYARRVAIMVAIAGLVLLIPAVSSSVVSFRVKSLAWGGLGIIVRVIIVWYLYQMPVREVFEH
jgi:hypothetical protein